MIADILTNFGAGLIAFFLFLPFGIMLISGAESVKVNENDPLLWKIYFVYYPAAVGIVLIGALILTGITVLGMAITGSL